MATNNNLPDVEFANCDTDEILANIITTYEAITGRTLYPSDPVRLLLNSIATIISQQRNAIDYAAKMNLLSYAVGDYLDVLGELLSVYRNDPQPALVTQRFTLSSIQSGVYTIPPGTEVAGGAFIFKTTETLDIPAGETSGTVTARCETVGAVGNSLLPGQINTMVKPLPFVASTSNVTASTGGADVEGDENLRERIRLAPASFSVAGPHDAYVYWARTANQAIIDVSVVGPQDEPGRVYIRPLLDGGVIPDSDVIEQVDEVVQADTVRPLTDEVIVRAPVAVSYQIDMDYWISRDDIAQSATIQDQVEQAVESYRLWQRSRMGRDINPDELIRRVKVAGAKRVVIRSPDFAVIQPDSVAQEDAVQAQYQGIEDA